MPVCATRIYRGETVSAVPYLALISALAGLGLAAYYYKAVEAAPAAERSARQGSDGWLA